MNGSGPRGSQQAANQASIDKRFQKPEPTRTFGPFGPPDPVSRPAGPSQAELDNLRQIRRAMGVADPWNPPPSTSSSEEIEQ